MRRFVIFLILIGFVSTAFLIPDLIPQMTVQHAVADEIDLDDLGFERVTETVSIMDSDAFGLDLDRRYELFSENMVEGQRFLEAGKTYYVIHKMEPSHTDFPNSAQFATVGYYFHTGTLSSEELFVETRTIGDSYKFAMDLEESFFVRFSVSINETGRYTYEFYQNIYQYQDSYEKDMLVGAGRGTGSITVVAEYSKAIGEDGRCKMSELTLVIKHDYSTIVCTTLETKAKLQSIGWALA